MYVAPDATVTLVGLLMERGRVDAGFGAGVRNDGRLTLSLCEVSHCWAREGGGIGNQGKLVVDTCRFLLNIADFGAGIANFAVDEEIGRAHV